eukprot:scaffold76470_cov63-Phaeocystis_antarctica.AAC.2
MRLSMAETVKIAQKGSYGYRYGHEKGLFDGVSYTLDRDGNLVRCSKLLGGLERPAIAGLQPCTRACVGCVGCEKSVTSYKGDRVHLLPLG